MKRPREEPAAAPRIEASPSLRVIRSRRRFPTARARSCCAPAVAANWTTRRWRCWRRCSRRRAPQAGRSITRPWNPSRIKSLDVGDVDAVVIGYLNSKSSIHARYIVRRLKRARSSLRVGIVFWMPAEDALSDIKLGATIGCDFIARNMRDAVEAALSGEKGELTKAAPRKTAPRKPRPRPAVRRHDAA